MKCKNKEIIESSIKSIDPKFTIGCYDAALEKLNAKELQKILANISEEQTDIDVKIGNKSYVVEISTVDFEKDFSFLSKESYINLYGNERYSED